MIRFMSSHRFSVTSGAVALVLVSVCFAAYTDLEVSTSGISGSIVSVSVHNPTSGPETARVGLTVLLDNGLPETLMSHNFTVSAGQTVSVNVQASGTVSSVIEAPDPLPPV